MENASITISLPRAMKKFIETRVREASFSTPSEYLRSLIRFDQERSSRGQLETFIRGRALPALDEEAWQAIEKILRQQGSAKRTKGRNGRQSRASKE